MRDWLPVITLFDDLEPHSAALNMAIDEALLADTGRPLLRVYRWARPAVSFGYFERWTSINQAYPGRDAVRRWTGGGVVPHGTDFTFSLLIPRRSGMDAGPVHSYSLIHGALANALNKIGILARIARHTTPMNSRACFENPVPHDVLLDGKKIAGGAQRRSRLGMVHQGSIQRIELPPDFAETFASHLSPGVRVEPLQIPPEAHTLALEKYGTRAWLEKIP